MKTKQVQILIVNASPRKKSNSQILAEDVAEGVQSTGFGNANIYRFAGKVFSHCKGVCKAYHSKNGRCIIEDDFQEFMDLWLRSDGVIYVTPVYHMVPYSALTSAITRLGAVISGFNFNIGRKKPRFCKVGGVVAQGNTQYGGEEFTMQQLINHLILMRCIPVSGDSPDSYIGVGVQVDSMEHLRMNHKARSSARSLGRRAAEMAYILSNALENLRDYLPEDYYTMRLPEDYKVNKKIKGEEIL